MNKIVFVGGALFASLAIENSAAAKGGTTGEEIAARYQECMGLFSSKDETGFTKCFTASAVSDFVDSGQPKITGAKNIVEKRAKAFWQAFPDVKVEPQLVLVNGNNIASIDLFSGTNSGPFMGAPASNKKMGVYMAHLLEVDPSKQATKKASGVMDLGTLMGQLGMSPAPHRPALTKGWAEKKVIVTKGDATEKANIAAWKKGLQAWNKHDGDKALADYAADAVFHDMGTPADINGKAEITKAMQGYWKAFPDLKGSYKSLWGAGDWIVAVGTVGGTNTAAAPELGIAEKTGKKVKMNIVELARFDGGKIKEHWIFYNGMAMAQQLGLIPPPPAAKTK